MAPTTREELRGVIMHGDELRGQLESWSARRRELAEQVQQFPDPAVRSAPTARLQAADQRIAQIERDLAQADEVIAAATAKGIGAGNEVAVTVDAPAPPGGVIRMGQDRRSSLPAPTLEGTGR